MNAANIPSKLQSFPQWCGYKLDPEHGKVPYQLNDQKASSTDPRTWTSFTAALSAFENFEKFNGVCFMLAKENGIVFIDLDKCIKDDVIDPWAVEQVERFNSYTEKSQSGKGLHILVEATKPGPRCRTGRYSRDVEIYDHARQCCLTGDILDGHGTIESRQVELNELYLEVFGVEEKKIPGPVSPVTWSLNVSDAAIIEKAKLAKNGAKFEALWNGSYQGYPSQSEADLALMNHLAYWTGDAVRMESLFSQSGLGRRDKWRDRPGYREDTVYKALRDAKEFYSPKQIPENRNTAGPIGPRREPADSNLPPIVMSGRQLPYSGRILLFK